MSHFFWTPSQVGAKFSVRKIIVILKLEDFQSLQFKFRIIFYIKYRCAFHAEFSCKSKHTAALIKQKPLLTNKGFSEFELSILFYNQFTRHRIVVFCYL